MKFEPIEQRSDAWYAARLGKPTASQFNRIIQPGRAIKSASYDLYMSELIAERIFKRPMGKDISDRTAVRWGVEHEDEARNALEERIGIIERGGFMTDDAIGWDGKPGRYGCSPDGLQIKGNYRELIEIKCPYEIPRHVCNVLFGPGNDHRAQVQGQLLISGYDVAHFWSYHPDCPPAYLRVQRDDPFIRALDSLLDRFCDELEENYQKALRIGGWKLP